MTMLRTAPPLRLGGSPSDASDVDAAFARIVDELSRRGFLIGSATAAALLGLAACGGSSSGGGSPSSGASGTTRISTLHGDVDVPADPKRIVTTDFPEACALLDLGITPVGRTSYVPNFPAYTTALANVPTVDEAQSGSLVVEKIAALTPDLIVGDDWADPSKQRVPYSDLAPIAPTALFEWQQAAGNWPTLAARTAAAVGKAAAMDALKKKYDDRAAAIKSANAALFARTSWDIIDCAQSSWDLYSAASSHGQVLTAAGVPLGAGKSQTSGYVQYSLEQFDLLANTDVIVTTTASMPYLQAQPGFTGLAAAKAGRVYATDLFFPASYGIAQALLEDLAAMCTKAAAA
jgi:iron complex transport system substrate-binding protein